MIAVAFREDTGRIVWVRRSFGAVGAIEALSLLQMATERGAKLGWTASEATARSHYVTAHEAAQDGELGPYRVTVALRPVLTLTLVGNQVDLSALPPSTPIAIINSRDDVTSATAADGPIQFSEPGRYVVKSPATFPTMPIEQEFIV